MQRTRRRILEGSLLLVCALAGAYTCGWRVEHGSAPLQGDRTLLEEVDAELCVFTEHHSISLLGATVGGLGGIIVGLGVLWLIGRIRACQDPGRLTFIVVVHSILLATIITGTVWVLSHLLFLSATLMRDRDMWWVYMHAGNVELTRYELPSSNPAAFREFAGPTGIRVGWAKKGHVRASGLGFSSGPNSKTFGLPLWLPFLLSGGLSAILLRQVIEFRHVATSSRTISVLAHLVSLRKRE